MTTTRVIADYLPPPNANQRVYATRDIYADPHQRGVITKKSRSGSYNVIEKDFGDHKRIYHIPIEYGDNYDLSLLDEPTAVEETRRTSPQLVRRRIYHQYAPTPEPVEVEYVEVPSPPPPPPPVNSRRVYVSPRREPEVIEEVIETVPVTRKVRYVYEDDYANSYDYRPVDEQVVEYVVREPAPKTIYMDEPRPVRRTVYIDEPPVSEPTPRLDPPIIYSPVRQSPPELLLTNRSPPPPSVPLRTSRFNDMSPPPTHRKSQQPNSDLNQNSSRNEPPPLRLMDVIAQNRARRGGRPTKPRREVDEAKVYDPPTYNRNVIKNGFIVHK